MRLGMGFIIFSGAEFLKPILHSCRIFAHFIVGVYSLVSNTGEKAPPYLLPLLEGLKKDGLLDDLIESPIVTTSIPEQMRENNRRKRQMGLEAARRSGCTHFMSRDCDEFYVPDQFRVCLPEIERHEVTIAPIIEYFHDVRWRDKKISGLSVPVSHMIGLDYARNGKFSVLVDTERTVRPVREYKVFSPDELLMHHMCCVRYDRRELLRKYQGHAHFKNKGDLYKYIEGIDGKTKETLDIVEDQFGILPYWEGSFKQLKTESNRGDHP